MVKANLTEVRDLGMQVNEHNKSELVDLCVLKFTTPQGQELYSYPLAKTCHGSAPLGKMIRVLLGRNLTKDDYVDDYFDSSVLLGKTVYVELNDNNTIIGVAEAI